MLISCCVMESVPLTYALFPSHMGEGVGNCTLHLLILNISDFVYLLHNQTACMQHVSYRPIYGAVPRAYKET